MKAQSDDTWAILKSLPDRPEYVPRGYEFLPDAFARDVKPHGREARDRVVQALAEGDIESFLKTHLGHWEPVPLRIWGKYPLAKKVYPRLIDGKMRIGLHDHEGPYVVGWVFVPEKSLAQLLSGPVSTKNRLTKFPRAKVENWYRDRVRTLEARGETPSRDDDIRAAHEAFRSTIPREFLRNLRRSYAPAEWQRGGRRPGKPGRN